MMTTCRCGVPPLLEGSQKTRHCPGDSLHATLPRLLLPSTHLALLLPSLPLCSTGQLCLSAALRTAMRGERVVFVDTSMSFSARRLAEMHSKALPPIQQAGRLTLEEALACITVYRVHDVWEALNVVSDVHETATQAKDSASGPRVLILDSLSAILSPIVGGKQQQGAPTRQPRQLPWV